MLIDQSFPLQFPSFHIEQCFCLRLQHQLQKEVRQTANYGELDPVSNIGDHFHPPASEGLHDVCGIFIRGWAYKISKRGGGIRLDGSSIEVHEFDVGLARDKPFIGPQTSRKSLDEGLRCGIERDTWDGELCRE